MSSLGGGEVWATPTVPTKTTIGHGAKRTEPLHLSFRKEPVMFLFDPEGASSIPVCEKVEYVKKQKQDRDHHCHWPGCGKQVKPALWGCLKHWRMIPKRLRDAIWNAFRPGQEKNMTPSREYVKIAREVQNWIKENHPEPPV